MGDDLRLLLEAVGWPRCASTSNARYAKTQSRSEIPSSTEIDTQTLWGTRACSDIYLTLRTLHVTGTRHGAEANDACVMQDAHQRYGGKEAPRREHAQDVGPSAPSRGHRSIDVPGERLERTNNLCVNLLALLLTRWPRAAARRLYILDPRVELV